MRHIGERGHNKVVNAHHKHQAQNHRQAAARHRHILFLIQLLHSLAVLLLIVAVFLFKLVQLRLNAHLLNRGFLAFYAQRNKNNVDYKCKRKNSGGKISAENARKKFKHPTEGNVYNIKNCLH